MLSIKQNLILRTPQHRGIHPQLFQLLQMEQESETCPMGTNGSGLHISQCGTVVSSAGVPSGIMGKMFTGIFISVLVQVSK